MPAGKQAVDALVQREARAGDEDPDGREQRPEEALLAVPEGVQRVGRLLGRLSEVSRKIWLRVSAQEWAASASIELDNVIRPAMVLPMAMIVLADSASSTVPLLSEAMVAAYP